MSEMSQIGAVIFSLLAIVSAVFMLILRHPMRTALGLVSVMLNLALVYGFLHVHVLAVGQVLIYVGAVMILMIYVIMLLDIRDFSVQHPINKLILPTIFMGILITTMLTYYFISMQTVAGKEMTTELFTFKNFAEAFLSKYWFHFELASILLLVATVAAITVLKHREKVEE